MLSGADAKTEPSGQGLELMPALGCICNDHVGGGVIAAGRADIFIGIEGHDAAVAEHRDIEFSCAHRSQRRRR